MAKKEAMRPIDTRRYTLPQPAPNEKNDLEAWQNAVNNAQSQYEHQSLRFQQLAGFMHSIFRFIFYLNIRIMNLGLLNEYGANAWLEHNKAVETSQKR